MSETTQATSAITTVPVDVRQSLLLDGADVQTKVGHVAKFNQDGDNNNLDENIVLADIGDFEKPKSTDDFVGLTKEELKQYINDPKWKRIRWAIAILYGLLLLLLLVGSILLIVFSPRCPEKPKLVWYQKEIIYEIDVVNFRDSNKDGFGDIKGVEQKLYYLENNNIKSILFQPSIFNATGGTSIHLDGTETHDKNIDLLRLDPSVGNEKDLQDLLRMLNRKDMHLIIDLPLSSTRDPSGELWYGSALPLSKKINNPCATNSKSLGCQYYRSYGRLPLDFSDKDIFPQTEARLRDWLATKKVDGVRVDLPLYLNRTTNDYAISYETLDKWYSIKDSIEKSSKPKLLLMDVPFGLQDLINDEKINKITPYSLFEFNDDQERTISAESFDKRIKSFAKKNLTEPKYWQLGSKRRSDEGGIVSEKQLPKEIVLTAIMLLGGTPVILYGEEIRLDQKSFPLMPWNRGNYSGFSACDNAKCKAVIESFQTGLPKTSVKREEAMGGLNRDSLLTVFHRLSKLREQESFQFGLTASGFDENNQIFWFIREAPGHRGYVIVFNLNKEAEEESHVSLPELTNSNVPAHVHYEYQWPEAHLTKHNKSHIDSDNLIIHPGSINIFWWIPKPLKSEALQKNFKELTKKYE